jgi:hypothetical protein
MSIELSPRNSINIRLNCLRDLVLNDNYLVFFSYYLLINN